MLSLEAASYETPQRVEMVARTLLGMTPPPPERVIALRGCVPARADGDDEPDDAPDAGRRAASARRRRARRRAAGGRAVKNLDPKRARWIRIRMGMLCGLMGLGLGAHRLGRLPRRRSRTAISWFELAERQRQRRLHIQPKRGTIYDRNGAPLAESVEVPSVSVDAVELLRGIDEKYVADARPAVRRAHRAGARAPRRRRRREAQAPPALRLAEAPHLRGRGRRGRARSATRTSATRCTGSPSRARAIASIPNRELAGPLLGFVSPDGEGKEGLELSLEHELKRPRLGGARPPRSLGPPALLRGHRGRAGARRAQRLPHHRQGHPVHRRARARRGDQDLRGRRRRGRRRRSVERRDPRDGERARASTPTTTRRPIPTRAGTAPSSIASSRARR